jgi:hypothetical protein
VSQNVIIGRSSTRFLAAAADTPPLAQARRSTQNLHLLHLHIPRRASIWSDSDGGTALTDCWGSATTHQKVIHPAEVTDGFTRRRLVSGIPISPWRTALTYPVLPHHNNENIVSAIDPAEVTKVCLKLRQLVQECVPCEMEEDKVTRPHSRIITQKVIKAAKDAGGQENKACVVRFWCPSLPTPLTGSGVLSPRQQTLVHSRGQRRALGRGPPQAEGRCLRCDCQGHVRPAAILLDS